MPTFRQYAEIITRINAFHRIPPMKTLVTLDYVFDNSRPFTLIPEEGERRSFGNFEETCLAVLTWDDKPAAVADEDAFHSMPSPITLVALVQRKT